MTRHYVKQCSIFSEPQRHNSHMIRHSRHARSNVDRRARSFLATAGRALLPNDARSFFLPPAARLYVPVQVCACLCLFQRTAPFTVLKNNVYCFSDRRFCPVRFSFNESIYKTRKLIFFKRSKITNAPSAISRKKCTQFNTYELHARKCLFGVLLFSFPLKNYRSLSIRTKNLLFLYVLA